uniref:Uncharacterized protein n=1 Tax=Trypanosoma congolense (strain IL3000) TaxID=1068625 RepID=F9WJ68_TRYCI|nr:hypothetical protein, unlikely [Trypanosoma congolense IL3000]
MPSQEGCRIALDASGTASVTALYCKTLSMKLPSALVEESGVVALLRRAVYLALWRWITHSPPGLSGFTRGNSLVGTWVIQHGPKMLSHALLLIAPNVPLATLHATRIRLRVGTKEAGHSLYGAVASSTAVW